MACVPSAAQALPAVHVTLGHILLKPVSAEPPLLLKPACLLSFLHRPQSVLHFRKPEIELTELLPLPRLILGRLVLRLSLRFPAILFRYEILGQ